jgi:hypothetical protein
MNEFVCVCVCVCVCARVCVYECARVSVQRERIQSCDSDISPPLQLLHRPLEYLDKMELIPAPVAQQLAYTSLPETQNK